MHVSFNPPGARLRGGVVGGGEGGGRGGEGGRHCESVLGPLMGGPHVACRI